MGCSPDSLLLPLKTHVEISHRTCACRPIKFNNLIRSKFSCFTPKHKFMVKNYCGALLPSYRRVQFPKSLSWGCVYSPTYWSLPPPPQSSPPPTPTSPLQIPPREAIRVITVRQPWSIMIHFIPDELSSGRKNLDFLCPPQGSAAAFRSFLGSCGRPYLVIFGSLLPVALRDWGTWALVCSKNLPRHFTESFCGRSNGNTKMLWCGSDFRTFAHPCYKSGKNSYC